MLRFWVINDGVIPASRGGKVKTALQSVAIGLYILPLDGALTTMRAVLMAVAVIVTVLTGIDYAVRAVRLHQLGEEARRGIPSLGRMSGP